MAYTNINDPILQPFSISKDDNCFKLTEISTSDTGMKYEKIIGYYGTIERTLRKVIECKLNDGSDYASLQEYYERYRKIQQLIMDSFGDLNL